jgi:hypothetical protein
MKPQLGHCARFVGIHALQPDFELRGDRLVAVAGRGKLQNLDLAAA